jgi:hypothetical protein
MTPWLPHVPGLLESFFPGEEGGDAIAAILFGDVDPSGKLPITLGARREDYPDYGNFPGVGGTVHYAEGIYVGYRHFDKAAIAPLFPFGFGLSYTTFSYSHLKLTPPRFGPQDTVTATVDITNTGTRPGAEVAELYVHDPAPKIDRPVRELKGFDKLDLAPGQTGQASFTLDGRSLAYCDVPGKQWKANAGEYEIQVGSSSRALQAEAPVQLTADYTDPIPDMGWKPAPPDLGIGIGRHVTASSVQQDPNVDARPENAVDTDQTTRWSSAFSDPQWLDVDLGRLETVAGVKLWWETAFARAYKIQVSPDNRNWTTVYSTTAGIGGTETVRFPPVRTRYVRFYGTQRATGFGYSLYTFGIYRK